MTEPPKVLYWHDRPVTDLTREELLTVVSELVRIIAENHAREQDRYDSLTRILAGK